MKPNAWRGYSSRKYASVRYTGSSISWVTRSRSTLLGKHLDAFLSAHVVVWCDLSRIATLVVTSLAVGRTAADCHATPLASWTSPEAPYFWCMLLLMTFRHLALIPSHTGWHLLTNSPVVLTNNHPPRSRLLLFGISHSALSCVPRTLTLSLQLPASSLISIEAYPIANSQSRPSGYNKKNKSDSSFLMWFPLSSTIHCPAHTKSPSCSSGRCYKENTGIEGWISQVGYRASGILRQNMFFYIHFSACYIHRGRYIPKANQILAT